MAFDPNCFDLDWVVANGFDFNLPTEFGVITQGKCLADERVRWLLADDTLVITLEEHQWVVKGTDREPDDLDPAKIYVLNMCDGTHEVMNGDHQYMPVE